MSDNFIPLSVEIVDLMIDMLSADARRSYMEGEISKLIASKMQALHPSESAGVNEAYQEAYDIGYAAGNTAKGAVWAKAITYKPTRESEYRPFRRKRDDDETPYDYGEIYITTDEDAIFFDVNDERQYAKSTDARWNDYDILDESPAAAQSGKEEAVKLFQRILNQANHARNTSGIDRLPAIKRLAKQGIEIFDPNNKALED